MKSVVAILGRPNVGKSTLFNRLVGRQRALVEDRPGVTRDRHYGEVEWNGTHFIAIDTGGFVPGERDQLLASVRRQAEVAMVESQLSLLVVDGRAGLTSTDLELAHLLRRKGKPALLVVNKIDDAKSEALLDSGELFRLGLSDQLTVSAEHGRGINDLLDVLVARLPAQPSPPEEADEPPFELPRIAVIGRPNAGKSTFLNRLLGEERLVANEIAGTTRDAIDVELVHRGQRYILTDTAGIKRKSQSLDELEIQSVLRATQALQRSDVAAVLIDAAEPAVEQDARLIGMALEMQKPLVILANKIDLLPSPEARRALRDAIEERLPFAIGYVPLLFLSAKEGRGMKGFLPLARKLGAQASRRIATPEINRFLQEAEDAHPAPRFAGHPVRLYYMAQVGVRPPTFLIHVNRPQGITEDYQRFLINRMRQRWGLQIPLRLVFRKRR